MYFDDEDEVLNADEVFRLIHREFYALGSNLDLPNPFSIRSVPTHTEDGIPIRKLYVSNLPPKTTRTELFGVFAQFGFIKSCWLRMGEGGPNRSPTPTYAFVTFSNPDDAHKALKAPSHGMMLRGRNLRISPADSWHQPYVDADGNVNWKPHSRRADGTTFSRQNQMQNGSTGEISDTEVNGTSSEETNEEPIEDDNNQTYTIMDILNQDCITHILSYVPIIDLIRSERVSKRWQTMIQEYLHGIRTYRTSWWQHVPVTLTTAVLRRVLQRLGGSLLRLHIDHRYSALNDRTAHTVGRFCPDLEELKVVGMHTRNWNPLTYGCKKLKSLSFISCNKLTDSSLLPLLKEDSHIESLSVANNTHVTGLFLTSAEQMKLTSLSFYNCYSLQGTVLAAAIETLPNLTTLRLDVCPVTMWKVIPLILSKVPKLEELSLSEYMSIDLLLTPKKSEEFCNSLACLTELKVLNLSRNVNINNVVMKTIAQSSPKLESLNISCCNARKSFPPSGVTDDGIVAVCRSCTSLSRLDVSYLGHLTDTGMQAVAKLPRLSSLTVKGNAAITTEAVVAVLKKCSLLETVDLCGCDNIADEVVTAGLEAVRRKPRLLSLYLASTNVGDDPDRETHRLLDLNLWQDNCNPNLRPDFVDPFVSEASSDDGSMDDIYDEVDFEDYMGVPDYSDDDLFLDDDLEDYEGDLQFHIPNIILL